MTAWKYISERRPSRLRAKETLQGGADHALVRCEKHKGKISTVPPSLFLTESPVESYVLCNKVLIWLLIGG
jgi:hypothetical protein